MNIWWISVFSRMSQEAMESCSLKVLVLVVLLSHMTQIMILVDIPRRHPHGNLLDKIDACIRDISVGTLAHLSWDQLTLVVFFDLYYRVAQGIVDAMIIDGSYKWPTSTMSSRYRYTRMSIWHHWLLFCWHTSLFSDTLAMERNTLASDWWRIMPQSYVEKPSNFKINLINSILIASSPRV